MYFWDYGNAFLLEAGRAGADIYSDNTESGFKYPSYVEDIMGPICFDYGFGPFRWVCSSGNDDDLPSDYLQITSPNDPTEELWNKLTSDSKSMEDYMWTRDYIDALEDYLYTINWDLVLDDDDE